MSVTRAPRRWMSRVAAGAVATLALTSLALAGPAEAYKPDGSRAEVLLEPVEATGVPAHGLTSGWWGHEGAATPTGTATTCLSLNAANEAGVVDDASLAALLTAMGATDLSSIFYAIVPTSADGSNEAPSVAVGQNAAEVFDWVINDAGFGTALAGTPNANDSVATVSTASQITAWVAAGRPVQGFDNNLVLHDVLAPGNPVSTTPRGTSILNTWPAGTQLSLVAYVGDGWDPDTENTVPIVARGGDGKAKVAWIPFTTVASPSSALRTSAGYQLAGPYAPTLGLADAFTGSDGTLTATIKTKAGAVATDATGTVEFAPVVGGVRQAATSVTVSNGVADLPISGLAPGAAKSYDVRYVPDSGAQALYLTTAWKRYSVINELPTTTALSIKGGTTTTFTAAVTPTSAAGTVTFTDGAKALGQATVSGGKATLKKALSTGKHTVTATFAPSDTTYGGSSASKTVWTPKLTGSVTPTKVKAGSKPKLTVTVTAKGASVAAKAKVTVAAPGSKPTTLTVTINAKGKGTVTLPKAKKGTTKVTISYPGTSTVLAASAKLSFKAS